MLNSNIVKNARSKKSPYKIFDKRGLFLFVRTNGSRLWRFKFRFEKKEHALALGSYAEISLEDAKELVLDALLMAVWRRKPTSTVTVHTDQGSQYTSHDWQAFL